MEGTQVEHKDIPLAEFLSVAIHLSEVSGTIIREVWNSGNIGTQQKDKNEGPVTQADLRVQKTIESTLKALYPTLNIQGEEEKSTTDIYESAVTPDQVRKTFISQALLNEKHKVRKDYIEKGIGITFGADGLEKEEFSHFNTKNAVVWVDPLDGTSDFVAGNLPAVTVLIGVSINGVSRIGIIHNPFSDEDQSKGRTVFGTVEHGAYRLYCDEKMSEQELSQRVPEYIEPFNHQEVPAEDHKVIVAASISHFSAEMKTIIETIAPVEIKRIGGAGNKCLNVASGNVDAYLHPSVGLKYWDLCAPETLIKAMGGYATNINEKRLTYHSDGNRQIGGLILAKNPNMHSMIVRRLGQVLTTLKGKFI